jgi:23S rRNA maturation-related 3'-5' exoribonuclease YhaM
MPDPTSVNPQVIDIINQAQTATMSNQVVLTSGAGKAYQSVAQSSAIAIQDATDALRNITTMATSAAGIAIAQMLANPATVTEYSQVLKEAKEIMATAAKDYSTIGSAAAAILQDFPAG